MKWIRAFVFAALVVAPQIGYSQELSSVSLKPRFTPPVDSLDNLVDSLDNIVVRTTRLSNQISVDSLDNLVGWLTNLMFKINSYENRAALERYKSTGVLDRINADQQKINRAALTAALSRASRSQINRRERSSTPGAFNLSYSLVDQSGAAFATSNILTQTGVTVSWQTSNASCVSFALPGGTTAAQATGLRAVTTPATCAASITASLVRPPGMTAPLPSLATTLELKTL